MCIPCTNREVGKLTPASDGPTQSDRLCPVNGGRRVGIMRSAETVRETDETGGRRPPSQATRPPWRQPFGAPASPLWLILIVPMAFVHTNTGADTDNAGVHQFRWLRCAINRDAQDLLAKILKPFQARRCEVDCALNVPNAQVAPKSFVRSGLPTLAERLITRGLAHAGGAPPCSKVS